MKFKKRAVEIQFNWLFVLIIGAVILILFSGIIMRQKNISETSKNVFLLNNLDAIFSGSEVSQGTVNIVKIPETKIEFRCNRYSIGKLSKQLQVMNVFPPSVLEGNQLIAMTLDFSIPYRVTNLVYVTSPKYRYIFIGKDDAQMQRIMSNETYSEIYSTLGEVKYEGETKARFIFFDGPIKDGDQLSFNLKDYARMLDGDVTALNIQGSIESGTVEFFRKQQDKFRKIGASDYMGKEPLFGAVFSDNPELYGCVMDNIFEKINLVTKIYRGKVQKIRNEYSESGSRCAAFIETAYSLENINQILGASASFTPDNIGRINKAAKGLQNQNRQAQLQSCATIY